MWAHVAALAFVLTLVSPREGGAYERSWNYMPTGNGHGFQVFDRQSSRIVSFLEHPYRYVAQGDTGRTYGVGRRELAHDIYFGVRIDDSFHWLNDFSQVEYEQQSNIIHASIQRSGVDIDVYYFAPFGYEGNGMVMLVQASSVDGSPHSLSFFAKANMKLGQGRVDPGEEGEIIDWNGSDSAPYGVETGSGGGHVVYIPIGGVDAAGCGTDADLYNQVETDHTVGGQSNCAGSGQVLVTQRDVSLVAGESQWWGQAVLFVNDNPNEPQAAWFKDDRDVSDIRALWATFIDGRDAKALHDGALAELESWRANLAPTELNSMERALWNQSEVILRMGQVRELQQSNRNNHGMVLAALPTGEWHTGWVRDAVYGIVAFSMTGHDTEARDGIDFFLGIGEEEVGFFDGNNYLKQPYRVSVCRYFGNGVEEGDFNQDGPNIETDGWGLVLWAARVYLDYSCDLGWLDSNTRRGDTVFEALHQIAQDIEFQMTGTLPGADASIWEVHWNRRQVFAYTAACQIRGLSDFAHIANIHGREDLASHYRGLSDQMLESSRSALVYAPQSSFASHLGVSGQPIHVDGSTVEMFNWDLVGINDPIYAGTMNQYSKLLTGFGGYRRLEPQLSLIGESSASEYDLSEWILLDLRIAQSWRRMGNLQQAEVLLNKVTETATVNDNLIPELFDANNGNYTGVVPMVGYGAGAWMIVQLDKYGDPGPGRDLGLDHCLSTTPGDAGSGDVVGTDSAGSDTGTPSPDVPSTSNDLGPPSNDTGAADTAGVDPWADGSASLCTVTRLSGRAPSHVPIVLLVLGAVVILGVRRIRSVS
jgi:hypothetical protein